MTIGRVALIFDHQSRPETTGVYCRRALGSLVATDHILPAELSRVGTSDFDLFLSVDDGLDYVIDRRLRPSAYWAIDTHLDFDRCLRRAMTADLVFAAQRDGAERLRDAGIRAEWLPLACDPELHRRHDVPKRHDVAFVGNLFPGPRSELLDLLRRRFPRTFVGNLYFEEMAELYSASWTAFNRSIRNDINMRVFESLACGSLLVTNALDSNGQGELFEKGIHFETYRDPEELLDQVAYYLDHKDALARIADAGMAEVLARHTYRHRMEGILLRAEEGASRTTLAPMVALSSHVSISDPGYFAHARPELLELIPTTARRILDLGCGAGRLGEAIKRRQSAHVTGVEINAAAARLAKDRLDLVLVGDLERMSLDFEPGSFDAVVCGDILEHLRDPARTLSTIRDWLAPGGLLVASIPNVRHHSVVRHLLEGNWTYESAGLLDRDHVRFFTRREIEKLIDRAGLNLESLGSVPGPGYQQWVDLGRPGSVNLGRLHIGGLTQEQAEEFYAYQYLITASPTPQVERSLTSIIILTHNQLGYTRECLDSLRLRTDEPYELIVVDNASTDGTVDYLRAMPDVRVIENAENRGFPAAVNQGLAIARGEQILLLNNDTVLTTGWLRRLLDVLDREPDVGLVGPCSNFVGSEQQVEVEYDEIDGLDGFAWDWSKRHAGRIESLDRLIGFCLLIRRRVFDRIGGLDERFGLGCFEDDDLCVRARQDGWRTVVARDAFVHHYGGRTFLDIGVDFETIMRDNERKFREKWADALPPAVARREQSARLDLVDRDLESNPTHLSPENLSQVEYDSVARPSGGLLLVRKQIRLSLCMIVRDNARTIGPCLESIRPWVDELVIVDTGSTDETPRIALDHGAKLFQFPWCDDFSAARNESLRHARGEWLFWMDSDDTISEECGRGLRNLVYGDHDPSVLGYVVQVKCPGPGEDGAYDVTVVDHVKLIRNRPDLRFEGRIHEQILSAIRQADGEVAWTDLCVVHSGSDHTTDGRARKLERDFRLLKLELAERPDHPFTLFNLGMTYADCRRYEEAVDYLRRSIAQSGRGDSHLRKVYSLLVYAQMQLGRTTDARETLREGRALFPDDAELGFRQGVLLHELGCLEESERAYRSILSHSEERHFSSLDSGIVGFKARQNLAIVLTDQGRLPDAESQWRQIVAEVPGYRAGWRGLGDCLLRQGDLPEAVRLAGQIRSQSDFIAEAELLTGRIASASGDATAARTAFEAALAAAPLDLEIHHSLCQFLLESGQEADGERALRDLLVRHPEDASAYHNLGTLALSTKRPKDAVVAYQESIRLRPDHVATHLQLGYAFNELGRTREAVSSWQEALRLDPTNQAAAEANERIRPNEKSRGARPFSHRQTRRD